MEDQVEAIMQPYAHILKGQPYSEFNPVCTPLRLLTDQGLKSYQQHNTHRDYDAQPLSLPNAQPA